jgi:hypothetical protein
MFHPTMVGYRSAKQQWLQSWEKTNCEMRKNYVFGDTGKNS